MQEKVETVEDLLLAATQSSPEIRFSAALDRLSFKGKSYIENTAQFYGPVFIWLQEYLTQVAGKMITVELAIVYFNSSSFKVFMNLFDLLDQAASSGACQVTVNWYYDPDDDMAQEYGEEFKEDLQYINFQLIAADSGDESPF
ncbi:DUF1987 domain-containing protein [Candidatus Magnetaquicoccus inordinatus]|uniref:DUF1987 domain-containing protein n=1 Tax=Candidatus Magnetaquicoccus inordinatus TaxID=2496818 RepID=UPI00102BDF65|nr:DUF1987 domain-containing protein [Candidatus Magnetaquicoccus inordinatus]